MTVNLSFVKLEGASWSETCFPFPSPPYSTSTICRLAINASDGSLSVDYGKSITIREPELTIRAQELTEEMIVGLARFMRFSRPGASGQDTGVAEINSGEITGSGENNERGVNSAADQNFDVIHVINLTSEPRDGNIITSKNLIVFALLAPRTQLGAPASG
ncbi:MAG: hypothetical protein LBO66_01060 [Deltaproteobacteria bacterium]|jgi:hypothetical protein|nr:hypothetical protein [Deltaproteobacteria bacterium]